jgi:hypothetical protein
MIDRQIEREEEERERAELQSTFMEADNELLKKIGIHVLGLLGEKDSAEMGAVEA